MKEQMYLTANIYRSDYDCELNFFFGKKEVAFPTPEGIYTEAEVRRQGALPIKFVKRDIWHDGTIYIHAVPLDTNKHTMAGGTYIHSCDSRFSSISRYPISLHDRIEN